MVGSFPLDRGKAVTVLTGLRRCVVKTLIAVVVLGAAGFLFAKPILSFFLKIVGIKIYYLNLAEPLLASVNIGIYSGIFLSFPVVVFLIWQEVHKAIGKRFSGGFLFFVSSVALFYAGAVFCAFVVLPAGMSILLSYGAENSIMPMITVERFVSFVSAMMFAFGITFQIPVILVALGKLGVVRSKTIAKKRRFAVLFITIASAMITPTPDAYNMMLLGVPMYALFEIGVMLMKLVEGKEKSGERPVDLAG